jgi:hypothetical protein
LDNVKDEEGTEEKKRREMKIGDDCEIEEK